MNKKLAIGLGALGLSIGGDILFKKHNRTNELKAILDEMTHHYDVITNTETSNNSRVESEIRLRQLLINCLFDPRFDQWSEMYAGHLTATLLGYDLDSVSAFLKAARVSVTPHKIKLKVRK